MYLKNFLKKYRRAIKLNGRLIKLIVVITTIKNIKRFFNNFNINF